MRQIQLRSVLALALVSLAQPAIAQSERYPNATELQQLAEELRRKIPDLQASGFYSDRRTFEEWQERSAYAEAWADVDPAIAPFLGEWTAIEESLYIYPSALRGGVCILDIYQDQSKFYTGQVRDNKLHTDQNVVFFLDNNFLGNVSVYENQPSLYEYAHPRPLPSSSEELRQFYPETVAAFEAAGCLVGLPQ
ncbi:MULTISPECIES: hypothetical protein [Cyanophyceae]|uniref:Uncharacterized protein n=1 Tax=Leptolyngbya subtilissima DQ-A4 TaxID=2933933 RepID=A0ABV0K8H0_9CYAN|nr:hypothetical protein [Nodosilinea sp. FACHB-141]MBD2110236.1 hypothetical protein [Nodosilinea sp. FACHB-141]